MKSSEDRTDKALGPRRVTKPVVSDPAPPRPDRPVPPGSPRPRLQHFLRYFNYFRRDVTVKRGLACSRAPAAGCIPGPDRHPGAAGEGGAEAADRPPRAPRSRGRGQGRESTNRPAGQGHPVASRGNPGPGRGSDRRGTSPVTRVSRRASLGAPARAAARPPAGAWSSLPERCRHEAVALLVQLLKQHAATRAAGEGRGDDHA